MKYCNHCGAKIPDDCTVCPHCGASIYSDGNSNSLVKGRGSRKNDPKGNAIASIVLAFIPFVSICGVILALKAIFADKEHRYIIIEMIGLCLSSISFIVFMIEFFQRGF